MEVLEAVRILVENRISGAPVIDHIGNLVGMLTERDCMKIALGAGYYGECGGTVSCFMRAEVETVDIDTPAIEIAERFINSQFRRFPVLDNDSVIGMISRRDVLRLLESMWQPDAKRA
jgi:CBS domain-containing protein